MPKTTHFQQRMSQRGVTMELVELVRDFGEIDQDKRVLGRRELQELISSLRDIERKALKALDKGGLVVVEADGRLITTYARNGFRSSRKSEQGKRAA
ncbi:hypothetical+protein [Methylocapsa aurea]|uniref:hypothetical protein n=1 Tax=Methylocapsa aurea TaxID=663610 RepID=UPI003D1879A4